ncbi:MAG: ROK family protein [Chloroflexi bacterium]|nr:ROK family protein [Chloroflexota bacterium]
MTEYIIGFDLGGTRMRAARLDMGLNIVARKEILTQAHEGADATIERMRYLLHEVMPEDVSTVAGIGISAPGPSNPRTGVVVAPPNLPGWHNVPIVDILKQRYDLPIYLGNDANVAALAEVARGAAVGARNMIFITVSTGIGGGIVTDGKLLLGKEGLGAEVGHMVMMVGDRVSTLEKEAAGPAIARQARARIEAGEATIIEEMVGGELEHINGSIVGTAAQSGDQVAIALITRAGRILGLGIASLLHIFNPEVIVIGGGVSRMGGMLLDPAREAYRSAVIDPSYYQNLRVELAGLGEDVSLIGAGALVVTRGGVDDVVAVADLLDVD